MRSKTTTIRLNSSLLSLFFLTFSAALCGATQFDDLEGSPDLRSASALIIGADGDVIYGKDIDTVRPIASIRSSHSSATTVLMTS